jgi:hypothetical protein
VLASRTNFSSVENQPRDQGMANSPLHTANRVHALTIDGRLKQRADRVLRIPSALLRMGFGAWPHYCFDQRSPRLGARLRSVRVGFTRIEGPTLLVPKQLQRVGMTGMVPHHGGRGPHGLIARV